MELLLPLLSFAFVSSITPGPNNLMLSASGVVFGFNRTLPHLLGVAVGFTLLLVVCASGIGALLLGLPAAALVLKVGGTVYLLYLAWTYRNALAPQARSASARPLRFAEAVAFQFVNPKAWIMGLTAAAVFVPDIEPRYFAIAVMVAAFSIVNLPCIATWAALGATLKRWLTRDRWRQVFSYAIALLTV
ncbi:MAG TPA: LysE family translocator, partial [Gammaproteobacteria bacterium]|nr:LysE family translocator [Gammaproteobacteria bacterium]